MAQRALGKLACTMSLNKYMDRPSSKHTQQKAATRLQCRHEAPPGSAPHGIHVGVEEAGVVPRCNHESDDFHACCRAQRVGAGRSVRVDKPCRGDGSSGSRWGSRNNGSSGGPEMSASAGSNVAGRCRRSGGVPGGAGRVASCGSGGSSGGDSSSNRISGGGGVSRSGSGSGGGPDGGAGRSLGVADGEASAGGSVKIPAAWCGVREPSHRWG